MATKDSQLKENKDGLPSIMTKQGSPSDEHKIDIRQARTPKHANTKPGAIDVAELKDASSRPYPTQDYPSRGPQPHVQQQQQQHQQPYSSHPGSSGYQYPPREYRYDQRAAAGGAPFSPGQQQHSYYQQRGSRDHSMAPTVSPGNDYRQAYYGGSRGEDYQQRNYGRPPPYDSRYSNAAGGAPPPPPPDNRFEYGTYQQQAPPPPSGGGYPPQQGGYRANFNPPDSRYTSSYSGSRQSYPPREYSSRGQTPDGRYPPTEAVGQPFSRTISSSFDRSVKSRNGEPDGKGPGPEMAQQIQLRRDPPPPPPADTSVAQSDDSSWRQLNQVTSIDETELQKRLCEKKTDDKGRNIHVNQQPNSTSSSLTNSPNDGKPHDGVKLVDKAPLPTPSKLAALDSLSSVASGQEPLDTAKKAEQAAAAAAAAAGCPPSPGSSAGSLDLMKCHSGSSGLLHGFHQRGLSATSLDYSKLESKRSREERGDMNTSSMKDTSDELRRTASTTDEQPPAKKARKSSDADVSHISNKPPGKSPLGIDCSPPTSPAAKKSKELLPLKPGRSDYNTSPGPSYFDKAPSYTYSLESNPSFPRDRHLLGRPPSSSSSTITPMERPGEVQEGVGPSLPSWDLQQQDSFGNGSAGGQLMSNFSFSHDYPGLATSGSNLSYIEGRRGGDQHSRGHGPPGPPIESRNQSFDGGHYHGDFNRSNSMDQGYPGNLPPPRQQGPRHPPPQYPPHDSYKKHTGSFPPHAPSWGTTTSTGSHHAPTPSKWGPPPPPSYTNYRGGPPGGAAYGMPMNRNYSEDSRTSPPPPRIPPSVGPPPPRGGGFQPPPEFAAPHNPHLARRPPPAVYIMSSSSQGGDPGSAKGSQNSGSGPGVYSWSKDDDAKLTEVMKKYKNPRDWSPIAKEHGRGKSSKECHERWIRYLKPGVRKGQWQDHEDAIVVEAVTTSTEQPFTRWSDLAQRLPGRVGKQIRDRWVNHLNPNINHLPFSREDDLLLWDGHKKLGKRWVEISTKYFNNSRSENHIKNRWYSASFKKFIANEFGPEAYSGGAKTGGGKKGKKKEIKSETVEAV